MLNIDSVETVYLACGVTDLRKSIDGLVNIVQNQLKLDPFDKALFVFCNKKMDKLKILVVDDESRMRKLVKDFLKKKGYEVVEAADG